MFRFASKKVRAAQLYHAPKASLFTRQNRSSDTELALVNNAGVFGAHCAVCHHQPEAVNEFDKKQRERSNLLFSDEDREKLKSVLREADESKNTFSVY